MTAPERKEPSIIDTLQDKAVEAEDFNDMNLARLCLTAADRIAELEGVLHVMIYEITHLSPEESDGSHWCKIRKDTLSSARAVLAKGDG